MNYKEYLVEAKVTTKDRKDLTKLIMQGRGGLEKVAGVDMMITVKGNNLKMEFESDKGTNAEITLSIIDICDTLGYDCEAKGVKKQGKTTLMIKRQK